MFTESQAGHATGVSCLSGLSLMVSWTLVFFARAECIYGALGSSESANGGSPPPASNSRSQSRQRYSGVPAVPSPGRASTFSEPQAGQRMLVVISPGVSRMAVHHVRGRGALIDYFLAGSVVVYSSTVRADRRRRGVTIPRLPLFSLARTLTVLSSIQPAADRTGESSPYIRTRSARRASRWPVCYHSSNTERWQRRRAGLCS